MKIFYLFFLLGFLQSIFVFSQIPTSNLVGKYSFNGNANNEAGNNANGIVNGAELTINRCGTPNSAYHFNGFSDYISVANFKLFTTNEISISLWAKAEALTSNCMIMMAPDSWQDRCVLCAQYVGTPTYLIWDWGNCDANGRTLISGSNFNTQWHHYVFITSISQNLKKIYVDSICVSTQNFMGSLVNYTRELFIGGGTDWSGGDIGFAGSIDDVRIYERGLTDSEVISLFHEISCATDINLYSSNENNFNLRIYPNPCSSLLNISFKHQKSELVGIKIINLLGEIIFEDIDYSDDGMYDKLINLEKFLNGIYTVNIKFSDSYINKRVLILE